MKTFSFLFLIGGPLFTSCAELNTTLAQVERDLNKLNSSLSGNTAPAAQNVRCENCGGHGWVPHYEEIDGQVLRDHADCPKCGGTGYR